MYYNIKLTFNYKLMRELALCLASINFLMFGNNHAQYFDFM